MNSGEVNQGGAKIPDYRKGAGPGVEKVQEVNSYPATAYPFPGWSIAILASGFCNSDS